MGGTDSSDGNRSQRDFTKRAGPMLLGPQLSMSPVLCISHVLARRDGTEEFYILKFLTLKNPGQVQTTDDIQGKILIYTEYQLLKLLKGEKGVVQQHGIYKDLADEETYVEGHYFQTGNVINRIILVLDCFSPHDYCPEYTKFINLQQYVIKEKRMPEAFAVKIFHKVVEIVERLHKRNVVHRDLKLGNVVVNKDTLEVTLTNFGLGKHLTNADEMLIDQRGSPAYISPDVICGKPYKGQPSDIWALGVVLYTMVYGRFPFYDSSPTELFRKIKLAKFQIPSEPVVSLETIKLINSIIVLDPSSRLTATGILDECRRIIDMHESFLCDSDLHIVPSFIMKDDADVSNKLNWRERFYQETYFTDIRAMLIEFDKSSVNEKDKECDDDKVPQSPTVIVKDASTPIELNADGVTGGKGDSTLTHTESCSIVPAQKIVRLKPILKVTSETFGELEIPVKQKTSNDVCKVRKTRAVRNLAKGTRVSTITTRRSRQKSQLLNK